VALEGGRLTHATLDPRAVGLALHSLDDLRGGDPDHNAAALHGVLEGARNAYRDIGVINAGAALVVAGAAATLREGVERAEQALDTGAARATLAALVTVSNA
jgi:anthranilate phosphoribosyltransferase